MACTALQEVEIRATQDSDRVLPVTLENAHASEEAGFVYLQKDEFRCHLTCDTLHTE